LTDSSFSYWDSIYALSETGRYPSEDIVRFMALNYGGAVDKNAIKVLDVGCGAGANIWFLLREGYSAFGIDGSKIALDRARNRLKMERLPSPSEDQLVCGNFTRLPWEASSFHAVIDNEALYANMFADIKQTISEILRTLKPGGKYFGKMFSSHTTGSKSGKILELGEGGGTWASPTVGPCKNNAIAHFFTREEIISLFKNFATVSVDEVSRTNSEGTVHISEWLVCACK
jgi:ubiquinone/menaquinone biosynthesis C-methylase UbiE